jgi:1-deoxy-D-xylulose-5-phosphate reductoisomerase
MEKIVLLGATGSVGSSALDVLRKNPEKFELIGVSGYKNHAKLSEIISEFNPRYVSMMDENKKLLSANRGRNFFFGAGGPSELAALDEADTVIVAVAGISGLLPTLTAIRKGKKILTANKESIVAAGELVISELRARRGKLIPLDSEHNAIFNLLEKYPAKDVESIVLTASGGPFRERKIDATITIDDVLAHPTWDMGNIITVNSATMMNKGFEVIEAHHLFGFDYGRIRVLIHPQSLVHGMAELRDGSHLLFTSPSDMRYPISLALHYPEIPGRQFAPLDLLKEPLEFSLPDEIKFPLLRTAYDAGTAGGSLPCALNAANETAVQAFLEKRIPFQDIPGIVQRTLDGTPPSRPGTPEEVLEIDRIARESAEDIITERP